MPVQPGVLAQPAAHWATVIDVCVVLSSAGQKSQSAFVYSAQMQHAGWPLLPSSSSHSDGVGGGEGGADGSPVSVSAIAIARSMRAAPRTAPSWRQRKFAGADGRRAKLPAARRARVCLCALGTRGKHRYREVRSCKPHREGRRSHS
jgi:hypothetical protein